MKIYCLGASADDDLLLAKWWCRMRDDGDLEKTFMGSALALSGFYSIWLNCELCIETDEEGITMAFWCQRYMGAASVGLWIRSDKRRHVPTLRAVLKAYKLAFDAGLKAVFGITKQPGLLPEHERLGYVNMGLIPGLWDGVVDAYVVVLTREAFMDRVGNSIDAHEAAHQAATIPLEELH